MKRIVILWLCTSLVGFLAAQQTEYRITVDGRYQYLSNRKEAGMIFDESRGTYYKDITLRTFYLETYRKGILPADMAYEKFAKLSLAEQNSLLNQPVNSYDCSSGNLSSQCLDFHGNSVFINQNENARVIDLSPKCSDPSQSKKSTMSLTSKMITDPNNTAVENNDCGETKAKKTNKSQSQTPTSKVILGKD